MKTNAQKSKTNKSKNKSTKKVVAKAAAVTSPVASVTEIKVQTAPVATNIPQVKRGRGRPLGQLGASLVSLKSLVDSLPSNATLPLSNVVIRSLNQLGIKIQGTPFKSNSQNLAEITNKFKKPTIIAQDLNTEAVVA